MRKTLSLICSLSPVVAALLALVAEPAVAAEGARKGLALCAGSIIPSLLPFFVLSGLLSALGLPRLLGQSAEGPMRRLFRVSGAGSTPLLMGLIGGYPVGAGAVAELVSSGTISREEGARLLPFCNNTGPAFIIGAVGAGVFGSGSTGALLYLCHVLAALVVGLLFARGRTAQCTTAPIPALLPAPSLPQALPGAVKNAALNTVYICGFVVFFSVIVSLLEHLGIFGALAGNMATRFGLELRFCRAALTGFLELGSGVGALTGLPSTPKNLALSSFILGFGGLSVHCQTLAAIDGSNIKCARHFAGRILLGSLSALFTYTLSLFLKI